MKHTISPAAMLLGPMLAAGMMGKLTSEKKCSCYTEGRADGYIAGKEFERDRIKKLLFDEDDDE